MELRDIAVATMTWARTPDEETLIRRSLCRLVGVGIPVAVADRGTNSEFSHFISQLPGVHAVTPKQPGLVGQVAAAFAAAGAFQKRFVLYTEPDKEEFFAHRLPSFVARSPDDRDTGIVLAARTPVGFATFPPMQRYTEQVANELCARFCGMDGDYMYGPFLIERELVSIVERAESALGWGWRPFVFRQAHELGRGLAQVTDDYECPADQRHEDDDDCRHRLRQLQQNIAGLIG